VEHAQVGIPCFGVGGEVLVEPKLRGVHVDGHDDVCVFGGGLAHEGEVALVKGAHGRDQADSAFV
jgi:hypothetical protein